MNPKQLETLFNPKSIAVIGASSIPGRIGYALFRNLISGGFPGPVYPVNPHHNAVQSIKAYANIADVPQKVDLAIIATQASTVPGILQECAASHVLSAVVIATGFSEAGPAGAQLEEQIREIVQANNMALLGPNSLGFIRPKLTLNASFARRTTHQGGLAFISYSASLCNAVLDWSAKENVGFSHFISVGSMLDIGFHDLIDYLGNDPETKAILIYMETLAQARRFMSAARSFARSKPIIVLKVGHSQESPRAALSHTGSLTASNQIFDAAFKRAGILRVGSIAELLDCGKTLSMQRHPRGNRLAIVTNAGGPGVIATDALTEQKGALASLSPQTLQHFNNQPPRVWSRGNPYDILGNADPARYRQALQACLKDPNVDGVLAVLTPLATTDATAVARDIVEVAKDSFKPLLAAFMGEEDVADGRRILDQAHIPAYETPEDAVRSFLNMVEYQRNLKLLTETPATIPHAFTPHPASNRQIINDIAATGRYTLTYPEVRQMLSNYEIPVPAGGLAASPAEARTLAAQLGFPLVMKIVSPDIIYEAEVGGVLQGIQSEVEIEPAYHALFASAQAAMPEARIHGVYLQQMVAKRYELLIGSKKDPIFGPVIVFGMGGVAVDVFRDVNIGIPPLNMVLAQQLIDGTKIATLLKGHRGKAAVDLNAIQFLLYKFAYLLTEFPEIQEMDINPFAVDEHGGIVLDAKITLDPAVAGKAVKPYAHLVISPYPREYETTIHMQNGQPVLLRPIRPEDEGMQAEMFATFSDQTKRFRFFGPIKEADHEMLIHYTQIDYDREIAIIAELSEAGRKRMLGVVRLIADPYNESAEYAIVLGDLWQGQGLGSQMTRHILEIARQRGIRKVLAYLLDDNDAMLHLFQKFGFAVFKEADMYRVELDM